ncbi:MAG TPA: hypothetical protein VLA60_02420 [Nitrospirales bacterium]|nr:hypothetical protein [Nitrospirales bacterium]
MINALPILFGLLESPPHVTRQAGGVGLDQAGTTENPSKNLFAKIFRNQTTAASFLNSVSKTRSGEDGGRGSKLDWLHGTQALSGHTLPSLYLASLLENNGQEVPEEGAVVGNSSIPLRAEGVNGNSAGGQVENQTALFGLLPGNGSQDESVVNGNVAPLAFLQGKPGGEIRQPVGLGIQAGLPLLAGAPSSQTVVIGSTLADQSAAPFVPKIDSERVLQNALAAVAGKAVTESDANQVNTVDRVLSPVQDTGPRLLQNPPSPIGPPQASVKLANTPVNQAFQVPKPFDETPAGIADAAQLSQNRLKYVSGVSSVLSESPANGKESSIGIPLDRLADANVSLTGDRSRDVMEVTGKAEGVDPDAGQGLNHGMGNPTHSQSGFQQSSSVSSPGQAVRMAEERVPDLPGPALQRLQMEVQLSETNRVQIDVGVQHRQVYASLLMDQATLKNLAVQFVPQLEEQLTQGEMELQEFSAEVRDHQSGQESDTRSDGAGRQTSQRGTTSLHQTPGSLSYKAGRAEEQGFYLVA